MDVSEEWQYEQLVISLRIHYPDIFDLWQMCVTLHDDILNRVMEANSVVTYHKMFVCPHCILTERPLESAHKLPLDEVMQPRHGSDYFLNCPNPDTATVKESIVPAVFLRHVIVGEDIFTFEVFLLRFCRFHGILLNFQQRIYCSITKYSCSPVLCGLLILYITVLCNILFRSGSN